jgi:hypothetical protein
MIQEVITCTSLGENKYQQTYNITKAGYYLMISRVRCFGGTLTLPTYISCKDMDSTTSDDSAGSVYNFEYSWVTLPMCEYLTVGTHTRQFNTSATFTSVDIRTNLKYLA